MNGCHCVYRSCHQAISVPVTNTMMPISSRNGPSAGSFSSRGVSQLTNTLRSISTPPNICRILQRLTKREESEDSCSGSIFKLARYRSETASSA
jgi:hypothetical protein